MAGLFRFYDKYFYNAGKAVFDLTTDTLKLALLADTYAPCTTYGTRGGVLNYALGDVIFSATYNCYFVCSVDGQSALGEPVFNVTPGAATVDGTVTWVSCGLAPPSTHEVFADVSANEIAASGYTAGGAALTPTYALTGRRSELTAPAIFWDGVTISAAYAVIYKVGTVGSLTNPLIGYVLLDSTDGFSLSSVGGKFVVRFGGDTIYKLGGW